MYKTIEMTITIGKITIHSTLSFCLGLTLPIVTFSMSLIQKITLILMKMG